MHLLSFLKNRGFVLLLLIVFGSKWAGAQHPVYYSLNDENGLPSNEVYQVAQDSFGYVWIGCDGGLFRYDGFEYKQYKAKGQNGRSISSIQIDKSGNVWCRNFSGQIYVVKGDSLRIVVDLTGSVSTNTNYSIDPESHVWCFKDGAIISSDIFGRQIARYPVTKTAADGISLQSILYKGGLVYYTQSNVGVAVLNPQSSKIRVLHSKEWQEEISKVSALFVRRDTVCVLSQNPTKENYIVSKIVASEIQPIHCYKKDNTDGRINATVETPEGNLWICTGNGVFAFENNFRLLSQHSGYFKSHKISNVMLDKEGSYWFTTLDRGIFICPSLDVIRYESTNINLPENNLTALLAKNDSEIIIGSHTGKIAELNVFSKRLTMIPIKSNVKTISTKKIFKAGKSIYISNGAMSEWTGVGQIQPHLIYNARDMVVTNDSMYFVMPEFVGAISLADLRADKKDTYTIIKTGGGRSLAYMPGEKSLYAVLDAGLYRRMNNVWTPIIYKNEVVYCSGLSAYKDTLWAATMTNGVIAIKEGKIVKEYNHNISLPENEIKCIKVVEKYVWACGNKGLYRIDKASNSIVVITSKSGINPQDINSIDEVGKKIALATNKGLVLLPEELSWYNKMVPSIKITSLHLDTLYLTTNQDVILPYNNTNFRIELSSVALRSRGKYYYQYRLIGLDSNWTFVNAARNEVVYSSIPSGSYVFEAKAINESGVSSRVVQLRFSVESPVWQKWWFYLAMFILATLLTGVLFLWRIRFVKRKAEVENKLTTSQLAAINAQMNPHFMYNTLNSIQDLILKSDIKNTNYYLSRFSSLMRKILEASQHNTIVLDEEIELLELYLSLEKLRFGDDFVYEIFVDENADRNRIVIPSIIIQPFVENALKHGLLHKKGSKHLRVSFSLNSNTLVCLIIDNGIGRKRAEEIKQRSPLKHTSFATKATETRLNLINSDRKFPVQLQIDDVLEEDQCIGTKVVITIPL